MTSYTNEPASAVWEVGALVLAVADALEGRFNPVSVRGEIASLARAASGHCYFTLKDASGQLRCAMFRRAASMADAALREGARVQAHGRLDVYAARGDLQLVVESLRLDGQGALFEQFLRLKAQLAAEGCFDTARKRAPPVYPRSVFVVTSLGAAALRDVATTLQRRVPQLPVTVFPALVQGEQAPASLVAALRSAYARHRQTGEGEVLLLVRGGGSLEDLWAFNAPDVIREVVQAPMPVIVGVGHESDLTLADFAADLRAPTPTAAAELCAPAREACLQALDVLEAGLRRGSQRSLQWRSVTLDRLGARLGRPQLRLSEARTRLARLEAGLSRAPRSGLGLQAQALQRLQAGLDASVRRQLAQRGARLDQTGVQLQAMDPARVLERGYAWLRTPEGRPVAGVAQARVGQALQTVLRDGVLDISVTAVRTGDVPYNGPR